MANVSEWRISLSHDRMILTNEHGFRAEFAVPIPGNLIVITLGRESYHFGFFPPAPPTSPVTSDDDDDRSQASLEPGVDPQNPIQL